VPPYIYYYNDHITEDGMKRANKVSAGKSEDRRPTGKPRRRWKDNIKMDFKEIGWEDVACIHLAQTRDQWRAAVGTVMSLQFP
jgi:hypothetical protein